MNLTNAQEAIDKAIQSHSPQDVAGAALTGWVLVAEWIAPDGEPWLSRMMSEGMTSWKRIGMLKDAMEGTDWDEKEAPA